MTHQKKDENEEEEQSYDSVLWYTGDLADSVLKPKMICLVDRNTQYQRFKTAEVIETFIRKELRWSFHDGTMSSISKDEKFFIIDDEVG